MVRMWGRISGAKRTPYNGLARGYGTGSMIRVKATRMAAVCLQAAPQSTTMEMAVFHRTMVAIVEFLRMTVEMAMLNLNKVAGLVRRPDQC